MRIEDFRKLKVGMEVRISDKVRKNSGYCIFLTAFPNGIAPIVSILLEDKSVCLGNSSLYAHWIFDDYEIELIHENKQLKLF